MGSSHPNLRAVLFLFIVLYSFPSKSQEFQFDLNGNMTVRDGENLTYDGRDLLTSIGGSSQFEYDASGMRVKKTYQGVDTVYLGDTIEIQGCQEKNIVGFAGYPVAATSSQGTQWLHSNHLGSVVAVTETDGSIYTQQYSTYGDPAEPLHSPIGYNSQRHDESGLIYLHARYYDPKIGKFLSPDPLSNVSHPSGLNPYQYAHNNPIMKADPTGLNPVGGCMEIYHLNPEGQTVLDITCTTTTTEATKRDAFHRLDEKLNQFQLGGTPNGFALAKIAIQGMATNIKNLFQGKESFDDYISMSTRYVNNVVKGGLQGFGFGAIAEQAAIPVDGTPDAKLLYALGIVGMATGGQEEKGAVDATEAIVKNTDMRATSPLIHSFNVDRGGGIMEAKLRLGKNIDIHLASDFIDEEGEVLVGKKCIGFLYNPETKEFAQMLGNTHEVPLHVEMGDALGWTGNPHIVGGVFIQENGKNMLRLGNSSFKNPSMSNEQIKSLLDEIESTFPFKVDYKINSKTSW